MKIIILMMISGVASADFKDFIIPKHIPPLSHKIIDVINWMNTTWKAGRNFEGASLSNIISRLGVHKDNHLYTLPYMTYNVTDDVPDSFDAREKWPNCPTINQIRDQGSCGSCWAVAATEAMSDRHCIRSREKVNVHISGENLLACCKDCSNGCIGGFTSSAWEYWLSEGIVTGGPYKSGLGCQPYTVPSCEHMSGITGSLPRCVNGAPIPKCNNYCQKGYNVSYSEDKFYGKEVYSISNDQGQIKKEIYLNGPVEATLHIYSDFVHYKSGVYQRHSLLKLGKHAVRILGYGSENGIPYWLAANSWRTDWGDKGFFKIIRGRNECDIESQITAGIPEMSNYI